MAMLADSVEVVIGVDTHKHTHTTAIVAVATGQTLATTTRAATQPATGSSWSWPTSTLGSGGWAIEGTGGYGAGLTRFLHGHAEQVVELDRPKRAARRHGPNPIPWMRPGPPAKRWAVISSPNPVPPGSARRCRCGWRRAVRRSRRPPTPNASCTRWWSPLLIRSVDDFAA
jgi:transposase